MKCLIHFSYFCRAVLKTKLQSRWAQIMIYHVYAAFKIIFARFPILYPKPHNKAMLLEKYNKTVKNKKSCTQQIQRNKNTIQNAAHIYIWRYLKIYFLF